MYKEIASLLDNIGYEFDKHKLEICLIKSEKKKIIRSLVLYSREINFDLWSNKSKSIISAIATIPNINIEQAKKMLDEVLNCEPNECKIENILMAAIRHSEEFDMVIEQSGDSPLSRFLKR